MNATTEAIVARLPKKALLSPADIAAACGLATSDPIIADIKTGRLAAARIGGKYIVSREEAVRYVRSLAYIHEILSAPEEAEGARLDGVPAELASRGFSAPPRRTP